MKLLLGLLGASIGINVLFGFGAYTFLTQRIELEEILSTNEDALEACYNANFQVRSTIRLDDDAVDTSLREDQWFRQFTSN